MVSMEPELDIAHSTDTAGWRQHVKRRTDAIHHYAVDDFGSDDVTLLTKSKRDERAFSVAYIAVLVPTAGLTAILLTVACGCYMRFSCPEHYPTVSYAAEFFPEYYVFTIGMLWTAYFIHVTARQFSIYLARRIAGPLPKIYAATSLMATSSLCVLALFDHKRYHDIHVVATIVFFVAAWVLISIGQHGDTSCQLPVVGYTFLAVNGYISNPLGFSKVLEAACELLAIVCQLFYMGTLFPNLHSEPQVDDMRATDLLKVGAAIIAVVFNFDLIASRRSQLSFIMKLLQRRQFMRGVFVPLIGLSTIAVTVSIACWLHFDCPEHLPVLSHAAEFFPEYYIFALGMNCTAYFMYDTARAHANALRRTMSGHFSFCYDAAITGTVASLCALSLFDSDKFFSMHVVSTIGFFFSSWLMLCLSHVGRLAMLRHAASAQNGVDQGKWCLIVGFLSAFAFGYIYVARRWPTPTTHCVASESLSEILAVVCQLLYFATFHAHELTEESHSP
ncbi:unnamed protein product [Aphanomyces euteiches]